MINAFDRGAQANDSERTAKACCVLPSGDTNVLNKALQLARRSIDLGTNSSDLPWFKLAAGLAEYRNGHYVPAEDALKATEQAAGNDTDYRETRGLARMFLAMSFARQNRVEEAQTLFHAVQAEMPALPKDERKPLASGKLADHDLLFYWLACKEAKPLIEGTDATHP
jgi:hypothetical protein